MKYTLVGGLIIYLLMIIVFPPEGYAVVYHKADHKARPMKAAKTFRQFIDSITYTPGVHFVKRKWEREKYDTLLVNGQYVISKSNGLVNQYFQPGNGAKDVMGEAHCFSFLGIGKKVFFKDTLMCWQKFKYNDQSCFSYNNARFVVGTGHPDVDHCTGSLCRINTYPVISMFGADTSFQYFIYTDDISGLKYGDIDHDGYLDFLDIKQGLTLNELNLIHKKGGKYQNFVCDNSTCYKINVRTFKKGRYETMKDGNGDALFLVIKLDSPLNADSTFEILLSNWPGI